MCILIKFDSITLSNSSLVMVFDKLIRFEFESS